MNKTKLLLITAFIILLAACSENDNIFDNDNWPQNKEITIRASISEGQKAGTKAGIVEGNNDYASGEKFYWNEGDIIYLYFVELNSSGEEISGNTILNTSFRAENIDGNSADFIGNIPESLNGRYNIYATKDLEQVTPSSAQFKGVLPQIQTQKGFSSKGITLPMLSLPIQDVEIVDGAISNGLSLNFSLKQLNSLLRFTIENNASQAMTIQKIELRVEKASTTVDAFANQSTVDMELGGTIEWHNINRTSLYNMLTLAITSEGNEATIVKAAKFDAYLSVLPSEGFSKGDNFVIEISFIGADGKNYIRKGKIPCSDTGSFAFLTTGFKPATRYYFSSELTDMNLEKPKKSHTITFEGDEYWNSFVMANKFPGVTSTTYFMAGANTYEDWIDPVTSLSTILRPSLTGGGTMDGYPWFVSSYNSSSMDTGGIGFYTHDLFVYNRNGSDGENTMGGGNNGSDNFITTYGYMDLVWNYGDGRPILTFADKRPRTIKGLYVNSTNYFIAVAANGNPLSPPLQEGEDVILIATGHDKNGTQISETRMTLATIDGMVSEWTYWDLSSLGDIVTFRINMTGGTDNGYGFSLPAYYAIDDITIEWEE